MPKVLTAIKKRDKDEIAELLPLKLLMYSLSREKILSFQNTTAPSPPQPPPLIFDDFLLQVSRKHEAVSLRLNSYIA